MKEDIRFIEIQLPQDSKIVEALIASRNKEENINNIEILLYLGEKRKPLKIILRPRGESLDFDVTTPLYHFDSAMKEEAHIGKAQISKALPIGATIKSNLTDLYSLSIEMVEEPTDSTESFIKRIKVLKDELGVAKETLRLTGDIFHILPSAKKRFNIVKNKIKLEHFASPELGSLNQKEDNPLFLYLDVPVSKSILLSDILKGLKEWKKRLALKPIFIFLNEHLEAGYVSKFVYKTHGRRTNDCTYELVAKCIVNNNAIKDSAPELLTEPGKLELAIKVAAVKSLEASYHNYGWEMKKKESIASYPYPIRFKDEIRDESLDLSSIENLLEKDNKDIKEEKNKVPESTSAPKRLETITVPFFATLENIIDYGHLIQYVHDYKVVFKIRGREFTGIIRDIETQDPITITSSSPRISPSDIKVIINISITLDCSEAIDNLFKEIYLVDNKVCVGSLTSHLLKNKPGVLLYTIKSYAKKEDRQTINIDMSLNPVEELERFTQLVNEYSNFPFTVSTGNEQTARIVYSADTEEEAVNLIMNIKEKLKNRFIENKSKKSSFSIYDNYINIETKTFSSGSIVLKVQDVVLVASKDLGKYFVVAKLQ